MWTMTKPVENGRTTSKQSNYTKENNAFQDHIKKREKSFEKI